MINDLDISQWAYLLNPTFQFVNTAGKPLTDGWMEVYIHGLGDKYYCASDFNGTLHPFKIPLDSLGSNIVLADPEQAYDIYVYNKFGSLIMSRYNVSPVGAGGGSSVLNIVIKSEDGTVDVYSDGTGNFDLSIEDTVNRVERLETLVSGVSGTSDYSIVHGTKDNSNFFLTDDGTDGIDFTNDNYGWKLKSGHIYQFNFNTKFETGENNRYVSGKIYLEGPGTVGQEWQFDVDDSYIHSESINGSTVIVTPSNLAYYELKLKFDWNESYESAPIVSLNKASIVDVTSIISNTISGVSLYNAGTGIIIDKDKNISVDTDLIPTVSAVSGMIDEAITNIPETATATLTLRTPTNKEGEYTTLGVYEPTGPNKTVDIPKEVYTFIINSPNTYYNDVIGAYLNNKEVIAIEIESWYASGEQYQNVYQNFAQKQYWGDTTFYDGGYVNFTRFDVDKNQLVTWKCEPQTPGSTGSVAKWTKTVTELGTGGLFVAEYNVTPYADIDAAFKSGKTVIVKYKESPTSAVTNYYQLCECREYEQDPSMNAYYFSYLYGWSSEYVYCFPSNWDRSTFNLATWEHVNNVVSEAVSGLATEEYVDNAIASAASGLKEICYIDYPTTPVSAITEAINNNQYPILKLGYDYIPLTVIGGNYYSFTGIIGGGQSGADGYSVTANTDTNTWGTPQGINFATNEWTTEFVSTVSGNIINTIETVSGDLHEEIVSAINVVTSNIPEQVQSDWTEDDTTDPSYIKNKPDEINIVAGSGINITASGDDLIISATVTGGGQTYQEGYGIDINGDTISVDTNVIPSISAVSAMIDAASANDNLFIAEYNGTSKSEMLNAYNSGKYIIVHTTGVVLGNNYYIPSYISSSDPTSLIMRFRNPGNYEEVSCVNGYWSETDTSRNYQVDWNETSQYNAKYIKNKPNLSVYTTSTQVSAIVEAATASIPAQVNSDWEATSGVAEILNKPQEAELIAGSGISIVASGNDYVISSTVTGGGGGGSYTAGDHIDITNDTISVTGITELVAGNAITITMNGDSAVISSTGEAQVQSDWSVNDSSSKAYIRNKPSIPAAQIQSDWNQTNTYSKDYIKNKPTIKNYKGASGVVIEDTTITLDEPLGIVAGSGINIVIEGDSAIVCCTVTGGGGGGSYNEGYGIDITGNTIAVDTTVIPDVGTVSAIASATIPEEVNLLPGSGVTFGASGTDIVVNTTPIVLVSALPATPISGVLYLIPEE